MGIDWTKPLEAVHTDGRVVPVALDPEYGAPDKLGHYTLEEEPSPESWYTWTADGKSWMDEDHAWTIRNASALNIRISDVLDEAIVERAKAYVSAMEIVHADPIAALALLTTPDTPMSPVTNEGAGR